MNVYVLVCLVAVLHSAWTISDEKRLTKSLLTKYENVGRYGRPVHNSSLPITVKHGLMVQTVSVHKMYKNYAVFAFDVWINLGYKDEYLQWQRNDYGGVPAIRIPPHLIWQPDIIMYNKALPTVTEPVDVVVYPDGGVSYIPPTIEYVRCPSSEKNGKQRFTCKLKYGSWTYDGNMLNLTTTDLDFSTFSDFGYSVVSHDTKRNVMMYDCCPEPYIDVLYTMVIEEN